MSELHAVFATSGDHQTFRVSDPLNWNEAQNEWTRLDDLRREGRLSQAKFFEVRAVTLGPDRLLVGPEVRSHDRYDKAKLNLTLTRPVVAGSKGFGDSHGAGWGNDNTGREKAARAAWKLLHPTFSDRGDKERDRWLREHGKQPTGEKTGVQGRGGWFYFSNGTTAAQGLRSLADKCERMGLIVQGEDGRWYVVSKKVSA